MTWNLWWRFGPWEQRQHAIASRRSSSERPTSCACRRCGARATTRRRTGSPTDSGTTSRSPTTRSRTTRRRAGLPQRDRQPLAAARRGQPSAAASRRHAGPSSRAVCGSRSAPPGCTWPLVSTHLDHRFDESARAPAAVRGAAARGRRRPWRSRDRSTGRDRRRLQRAARQRRDPDADGSAGGAGAGSGAERLLGARRRRPGCHVAQRQPVPDGHRLAEPAARLRVRQLAASEAARQPGACLAGRTSTRSTAWCPAITQPSWSTRTPDVSS